jgi:predicted GTPase
VVSGRDFPDNITDYHCIVHCGGCMLNRRDMQSRLGQAQDAGVPITNYGLCIAYLHGVLSRVLTPFPAAARMYTRSVHQLKKKRSNS